MRHPTVPFDRLWVQVWYPYSTAGRWFPPAGVWATIEHVPDGFVIRPGRLLTFGRVATLWLPKSLVESVQRRAQIVELQLRGHPDDPLRIRPFRVSPKQLVADFAATGVPIREAARRDPLLGLRRRQNWRGIGLIVATLVVASVITRRPVVIFLLVVAVVWAGALVEVLRLLTGNRPERILQGMPDGTRRPISALGEVQESR